MENKERELAVIITGSDSMENRNYADEIGKNLKKFKIAFVKRIGSAHKTPWHVLNVVMDYQSGSVVFVAVAGRSDALSAFVDRLTTYPVISAPPPSKEFGIYKYLSSVDTPSGVGNTLALYPEAVAIAVAKILSITNPEIRKRIERMHNLTSNKIIEADKNLKDPEEY